MEVSVIIPVYNVERYVGEAVDSALAQPEVAEVILIEDGSSDGTLETCCAIADRDKRVKVLQHPGGGNRGPGESRNLGIRSARCDYIAFLDADDYYLPDRFSAARAIMERDPSIDGVYDALGTHYEHERTGRWWRSIGGPELTTVTEAIPPERLFEALLDGQHGYFSTDTIVVRRTLFEKTGLFDVSLRLAEDIAMWLKMAAVGRLAAGCIDTPVSMRRLHGGNTTFRNWSKNNGYAIQMWRSLLKWARRVGLPLERRVLLVNILLNFCLANRKANGPYFSRKLWDFQFLTRFVARHPLALRSSHYRGLLSSTLGLRRLTGLKIKGRERPELARVED